MHAIGMFVNYVKITEKIIEAMVSQRITKEMEEKKNK